MRKKIIITIIMTLVISTGLYADDSQRSLKFSFANANIRNIIERIGQLLKKPVIMDEKISFDITTNIKEEVDVDAALSIIQDTIKQRGFCIIEKPDKIEVKTLNESHYSGPVSQPDNFAEHLKKNNFITFILETKYIDINDIFPIIQSIIAKEGMINNIRSTNIIIISGFSKSIEALINLVETIDKPDKGYRVKLAELKYIDPQKLTNIINQFSSLNLMTSFIQPSRPQLKQIKIDDSAIEPFTGRILAIPLPNSMKIIIAANYANFSNIEKLVQKIDIPDKIGILKLNYIAADEVKQLLNQMYKEQISVNVYKDANTIIVTYSSDELFITIKELLTEIDKPFTDSRLRKQTYIFKLKNASAAELTEVLKEFYLSGKTEDSGKPAAVRENLQAAQNVSVSSASSKGFVTGDIGIVADKLSNSIIVSTTAENIETVRNTVFQLDVEPKQVLIEAVIAELNYDDEKSIGSEFFYKAADGGRTVKFKSDFSYFNPFESAGTSLNEDLSGLKFAVISSDKLVGLLHLFQKNSDMKILSKPRLFVSNNQSGEINVGDEVPLLTTSTSSRETTSLIEKNYQYKNVGIVLKVTPAINNDNLVRLKIKAEIKALGAYMDENEKLAPTIQSRIIDTTLSVMSENTIILGGLVKNKKSEGEQKVPILGDIPVLKHLFRKSAKNNTTSELVFFITPRVTNSVDESEKLTKMFQAAHKELLEMK
ncbi:MAG TPA: secretin N-terminal domain-containing protein [bacterium]|nr:secretin N-terminal domain-containing protein [bacterium]HPN30008.1 secretin N-terminal domain-containing protein [bacterium]